jgi:hypothetical protein
MRTYTNLAWPDDPYRASQQLYRRPGPMLAAFAALPAGPAEVRAPAAIAFAYLALRRSRAVTVTEDTLAFGFRAASAASDDDLPALARAADLDLLQARRHARFLAGHALADSVRALRQHVPVTGARGLAAVEADWNPGGARARGKAEMIDSCTDGDDLATACRNVGITASPPCADGGLAAGAAVPETAARLAAVAAERALVIALACARKSGLYAWDGTMDTTRIMDVTAWDLFPDTARAGVPYEQTVS